MGEKEVQKSRWRSSNKSLNLTIFNLLKRGKRPAQIGKELGLKKTNLQYYLSSLKSQGIIKKVAYGTWEIDVIKEVQISSKDTIPQPQHKEVRGHAFIWKVKVPNKLKNVDWRGLFKAKNIDFKEVGLKGTPRVFIEGRKIWFGKKNIIVYEPGSFFDVNAMESRKLAVFKLLDLLRKVEDKIGMSLSPYKFTPRREHFALVKNALAVQCNKEGEKIYVKNNGGLWFLIDNSYNLDEAETIGKDALKDNIGVQRYFNEHKETNFQVTPKFLLKAIGGVTQNQEIFAENMKTHISAIQTLGTQTKNLVEQVEKLSKVVERVSQPKDI